MAACPTAIAVTDEANRSRDGRGGGPGFAFQLLTSTPGAGAAGRRPSICLSHLNPGDSEGRRTVEWEDGDVEGLVRIRGEAPVRSTIARR